MVRVIIESGNNRFTRRFDNKEDAETWANSHHSITKYSKITYMDEAEYKREMKRQELAKHRDTILKSTDWLFMADVPTPQKHRRMYLTYRQYMRDVPKLIQPTEEAKIEPFSNWLRRKYPEEFLDGGDFKTIIHRFTYYYKDEYDV